MNDEDFIEQYKKMCTPINGVAIMKDGTKRSVYQIPYQGGTIYFGDCVMPEQNAFAGFSWYSPAPWVEKFECEMIK